MRKPFCQPLLTGKIAALVALICVASTTTLSQVPIHSSTPNAGPTVLLDFDGHFVAGTSWNWDGPINAAASGLTNENVTQIFKSVAEDFSIFNINITTDQRVYESAPVNKRMRVIVTTTWEWYGRAGGASYIGSFTYGDDTPCWVFSALHNFNVKHIQEAISHEIGHTLGLHHQSLYNSDCQKTHEYAPGSGTGITGWAPIMGISFHKNITTWTVGTSSKSCNDIQDDIALISSAQNGVEIKEDDHGNDFADATAVDIVGHQFSIAGLIAHPTDRDVFRIDIPASTRVSVQAIPGSNVLETTNANLDITMTVYNANGQSILSSSPPAELSAFADISLAAGVYFIAIEGTGNSNLSKSHSLGSYTLSGSTDAALPVYAINVDAQPLSNGNNIRWQVIADEDLDEVTLEHSINGREFRPLLEGKSPGGTWLHTQPPPISYYRIVVKTTSEANVHHSRIIVVRSLTSAGIRLHSSVIHSHIDLTIPATGSFQLSDPGGRRLLAGQLQPGLNRINLGATRPGVYFLIVYCSGQRYVYRLMKE